MAVFTRRLSDSEILGLANKPRLEGSEPGLLAGYTFDSEGPKGEPLPQTLKRPYNFFSNVDPSLTPGFKVLVSQQRESATDALFLPKPVHMVPRRLPFPAGAAYRVLWGPSTENSSHNGTANFGWDFVLANGQPSCGEPLLSSADGTVPRFHPSLPTNPNIVDDGPMDLIDCGGGVLGPPLDGRDYIRVLEAPGQIAVYLHTQIGSITDAMDDLGQFLYPFGVGQGDRIARIGTRCENNCHVHTSVSDPQVLRNYPSSFVDYEVSEDGGQTWTYVAEGIPQTGQWVRAR